MKAEHVGGGIYEIERRGGFLWLRKFRAKAYWRGGWHWLSNDKPVKNLDAIIALTEAMNQESWNDEKNIWLEVI